MTDLTAFFGGQVTPTLSNQIDCVRGGQAVFPQSHVSRTYDRTPSRVPCTSELPRVLCTRVYPTNS